jgi:putative ABC transport system permease protein
MIVITIAFRNLLRRKSRMFAIGFLVLFGTLLIVLGETFSASAQYYGKASIIDHFTGDFILYSSRSREKPTPFAFTTPLPLIQDIELVIQYLRSMGDIRDFVPLAQNYSLVSTEERGQKAELPFIFYAVDPIPYARMFNNFSLVEGSYFGTTDPDAGLEGDYERGILLSKFQVDVFLKNYNTKLNVGDSITVLGLTEGGSVNAVKTKLVGIFEPKYYTSVFNYINLLDIETYSGLYNFTGVKSSSLPDNLNNAFNATDEADIFALGNEKDLGVIDTSTLTAEEISGYTMIAVKLKDHARLESTMKEITAANPSVLASPWNKSSGGFSDISTAFQAFIYLATLLIFMVVTLIFTNTLIINVIERTAEIGTLRAMGGEKSFIRRLYLSETFILNTSFALLGMVVGCVTLFIFSKGGIPLPETVSQFLIGGGNLPVRLSALPFIEAAVIVAVVSFVATLYPIRVATKITPLKAMSDK